MEGALTLLTDTEGASGKDLLLRRQPRPAPFNNSSIFKPRYTNLLACSNTAAMPTYRSISIKLHSQFDIETYPEYIPRSRSSYAGRGMPTPTHTPVFDDEATSTCNVYIPVYPNSQFWLSYAVYPPVPEDQHFLFKLYINNAHVVSWSTGKEDEWKGKTMFALFEMEDEEGRKRVEKRLLLFSAPKEGKWEDVKDLWDEKACLEIKVHRARGKKRVERVVEKYSKTEHGMCERGVR